MAAEEPSATSSPTEGGRQARAHGESSSGEGPSLEERAAAGDPKTTKGPTASRPCGPSSPPKNNGDSRPSSEDSGTTDKCGRQREGVREAVSSASALKESLPAERDVLRGGDDRADSNLPPYNVDGGLPTSQPHALPPLSRVGGNSDQPAAPVTTRRKGRSDATAAEEDPASKRTRRADRAAGATSSFTSSTSSPIPPATPCRLRHPWPSAGGVIDAETALAALFPDRCENGAAEGEIGVAGLGGGGDDEKELLTNAGDVWVRFRAGHAGDASALASLCRRATGGSGDNGNAGSDGGRRKPPQSTDTPGPNASPTVASSACDGSERRDEDESGSVVSTVGGDSDDVTNLELRLASGFGDEQTPPAFHAILAEVHCFCIGDTSHQESASAECRSKLRNKASNGDAVEIIGTEQSKRLQKFLGGAAIVSLEWDTDSSSRILHAEFLHVDQERCVGYYDLLRRRLVLRLTAFALATGCAALRLPSD